MLPTRNCCALAPRGSVSNSFCLRFSRVSRKAFCSQFQILQAKIRPPESVASRNERRSNPSFRHARKNYHAGQKPKTPIITQNTSFTHLPTPAVAQAHLSFHFHASHSSFFKDTIVESGGGAGLAASPLAPLLGPA